MSAADSLIEGLNHEPLTVSNSTFHTSASAPSLLQCQAAVLENAAIILSDKKRYDLFKSDFIPSKPLHNTAGSFGGIAPKL